MQVNKRSTYTCPVMQGHEATDTGLAYAPVSQAHGHHHTQFNVLQGGGGCAHHIGGGRTSMGQHGCMLHHINRSAEMRSGGT